MPGPGRSALSCRFFAFCPAFAFARWRALALVMFPLPFNARTSRTVSGFAETYRHARADGKEISLSRAGRA